MKKIPIIAVVGPTASGKTELAIELAKKLDGEIISFDSMQIYKGMHIASAAPDAEEMQGIPHHLIEFLEPNVNYSVADFIKAATKTVEEIQSRGKQVIIAGGTGLYVNSFIDNLTFSEEESNPELRESLNAEYDEIGGEAMLQKLRLFDPESAERLHPNNKKRVVRAFEIYMSSGITMTQQLEQSRKNESPYEPYMIGISFEDRAKLYDRINLRVDKMLENGLEEEARQRFAENMGGTAVQAIGHKELFAYFSGEASFEEAVEELKAETRRYAKRQLTWFRRDERINWIYRDKEGNALDAAMKTLERIGYFGKTE